MRLGFHFHQTMTGAYFFLDSPTDERAARFAITARAESVTRFVFDKAVEVDGIIDLEAFATARPLCGALLLKLIEDRRLRYDLAFDADDGKGYVLRGEQDVMLIAIVDSLTTLPASLYDSAGREIARALFRFDLQRDLGKLLKSIRIDAEF
jgi:hypothetical protein